MDVLVLSCGTGGGHNSAAKAVSEEMMRRGHQVTMLNPYTLKSTELSKKINNTYISTVQKAPKAFGTVYKIGDLYRRLPFRSPVYLVNHAMNHSMEDFFNEHPVDVVIMPHLFPAEIMTNMRLHGMNVPKTIFIATDYVCIPFTEETECDAYVIPSVDLTDEFVEKGIPKEKLYPIGIPTAAAFRESRTREQEKQYLGLDIEKKYILISGGSMGSGKIEKAIEKLQGYFDESQDVELIVVCGSNQKLYQKLIAQKRKQTTVIKYTNDMVAYMRACNLFITKPGGLSSTEAAVCGIPIIHTAAIPGCESCNARYFSEHGMSIISEDFDELVSAVKSLLEHEERCTEMIASQKKGVNPEAAADICTLAENIVNNKNFINY